MLVSTDRLALFFAERSDVKNRLSKARKGEDEDLRQRASSSFLLERMVVW